MVTNQIMIRETLVEQRTCDGFFNANSVLKIWNENNPNQKKSLAEFKRIQGTRDFITHLIENEGIEKPIISSPKGTWMCPIIFVDFCMWISLEFKTLALKYVLDGLIKMRHNVGDYYNQMCATIMSKYIDVHGCKPPASIYIREAQMINEVCEIGKERNIMTEKELNILTSVQKMNAKLIMDGVGFDSRKKQLTSLAQALHL